MKRVIATLRLVLLLVFLSCLLAWPLGAVAQTTSVTLNGGVQYQKIDGFGAAEAWGVAQRLEALCDPNNPDPQLCAQQQQILDLLFSSQTGAGLTIVRMMAPSDSHTIEPHNPGDPSSSPTYFWDHDVFGGAGTGAWGQLWLAKKARAYGVSQFYLDAWSAPGFMKTSGLENANGTLCNGSNCPGDWRQAYANYLTQYLRFYQSDGVNITHLGAFNEPDIAISSNHSSEMQMSSGQAANFLEYLGRTASAAGFSPQIICCEVNNWDSAQSYINAIDSDPNASPWTNVFSGHGYGGHHHGVIFALTDPVNRHVWQTEWADNTGSDPWDPNWDDNTDASGIKTAYTLEKDMTDGNLSAYFTWQGADVGSPLACNQSGSQFGCNGMLIIDSFGTVTPAKRLWAMAQFSRYVHPGATRIAASSGDSNLLISAFQNTDGTVVVVALNMNSYAVFTGFSLQNVGNAINGNAAPFITDSFNNISPQNAILVQNGQFSDRVAARALVSYVITPGNVPQPGAFINQGSNMCFGPPGGSMNGIQLVQWYCDGSNDQNWLLDPNNSIASGGLNYMRWINQRSGLCLGVASGSTTAGAAVMQWACYNAAEEYWAKVDVGGGFSQLVNFRSGQCVGVSGGSHSAGAKLVQWPCYGPADQHWRYTGPHNLSVSFTGDGNGMVTSSSPPGLSCPNFCAAPVSDGTTVTLTAAPNAGSAFTGWSGACSGNQLSCTVVMNGDQTVMAGFASTILPSAILSPASVDFGMQNVGSSSSAQNFTLLNNGSLFLAISGVSTSGAFSQTNNCGNSLAPGTSCTISVTFTPTAVGGQSGTLTVSDNAAGGGQTASLAGTGVSIPNSTGWEALGGGFNSDFSCTSWGANRIDCFALGLDNAVWHDAWDGTNWSGWESRGGGFLTKPNCVSRGFNLIDCFSIGMDRALYHQAWDGSSWGGWEYLGGGLMSPPNCIARDSSHLDCFALGMDNQTPYYIEWDGSGWSGWQYLGGGLTTPLNCNSRDSSHMDCFALGLDSGVWYQEWNGSGWVGWQSLGGNFISPPDCVALSPTNMQCFAIGSDGMDHQAWNGTSWQSGWDSLGGSLDPLAPSCVSRNPSTVDCFARATDQGMWHRWWDGGSWLGWQSNGGGLNSAPTCVSSQPNRVDCVALGLDNSAYHQGFIYP